MHVLPQATSRPGDLLTAELGEACYDAVLLGQITYYLTPAQNADLFRRIYTALSNDGILVVDAPMESEQPSEWVSFVTLMLWSIGGGTAHSFDAYRILLEQEGFRQVKRLSERWLSASK